MEMLRIEGKPREMYFDADGNCMAVVDLQVSTTDELPEENGEITGTPYGTILVQVGSIAQVIQTGKWYTLDEDGSWYDDDGNEPEDS